MPISAFPLNSVRPPTTYDLEESELPRTEHRFDDGVETNIESDDAHYRLRLHYQILLGTEADTFDAHYQEWQNSTTDDDFSLTERKSNITYTNVRYVSYKKEHVGKIERRTIELEWWA